MNVTTTIKKTFAPSIFNLNNEVERNSYRNLLITHPHIEVYDEIQSQLIELVKSRNPKGLTSSEMEVEIDRLLQGKATELYGVWVYYPWIHKVVHILDREEFIELRTNRNQNKITREEREILSTKKIGVIGLSVGQSVALTLLMERVCGEIRLADFDVLELSNLNRIRTPLYNLGVPKVIATAREISEIDPFVTVRVFDEGLTPENMPEFMLSDGGIDILVDECDGLDIKIQAREFARQHKIPVLMDTSDRGMFDVERYDLDPNLPILHGLAEGVDSESLKGLTNEEKIPFVMKILGVDDLSPRAKASALEVNQTITTWPQLASSVILGGAVGADVSRRILLNQFTSSGRYFVDVEQIIADPIQEVIKVGESIHGFDLEAVKLQISKTAITPDPHQINLPLDTLEKVVLAACEAPSGGNCQPWKWFEKQGSLILVHDKNRSDSPLDFNNTGTFLAFGAAAENLVIQAQQLGYHVKIETLFENKEDTVIAVFRFYDISNQSIIEKEHLRNLNLASVIYDRETNRKNGPSIPLSNEELVHLEKVTGNHSQLETTIVSDAKKLKRLGAVIGEIDRLWILDEKGHGAFMDEIRWDDKEVHDTKDGIDIKSLELNQLDVTGLSLAKDHKVVAMLNKWGLGRILTRMSGKSLDSASAMVLFTMPNASPNSFFEGGKMVERFWLEAQNLGLNVQPMSISVFLFGRLIQGNGEGLTPQMKKDLPRLRNEILDIFETDDSKGLVFMLRISKGERGSVRSLRLPLSNVFIKEQGC